MPWQCTAKTESISNRISLHNPRHVTVQKRIDECSLEKVILCLRIVMPKKNEKALEAMQANL